jgi:hypothetical protein
MAVVKGTVLYSHLQEASKEENGFKSKYSIDLVVDAATKAKLLEEGGSLKINKKTGQEYFNFWSNGKNKEGKINPPIKVVDAKKQSISAEPGQGSVVKVQYSVVEWNFAGKKGTMLALGAVQVLNLQERGVGEFDEEEGYTASGSSSNSSVDASDFDDDDIPF